MCMMTELFVPCFFGSVALEKSQLIGQKIYKSEWIQQDQKYKQAFLIFLCRSNYPIHLTVYKILYLDLSTFLKVNFIKCLAKYIFHTCKIVFRNVSDFKNSIFNVCSIKKCLSVLNRFKIFL